MQTETLEGIVASVKYLLKVLKRAMGMEEATKKRKVEEFLCKKLDRRPGQPLPDGSTSEKAVLDIKAERLNVELRTMGWHLFEMSKFDPRATRTCVGMR